MYRKRFLIVCIWIYGFYFFLPYFFKIEIKQIPISHVIYDENHIEIWEIISEKKYRHREKNITEFPDFLKKSLLSIEDRRFYYHSWIDFIWIIRAFKNNIIWWNREWASTIETQIIRNNYWLHSKRTFWIKIKEFLFALWLNKEYSKNQIFEIYLNTINFWYLNYGFESASLFYYNKSLTNLTKAEMIWLITIIKNPTKYNPIDHIWNFNKRFQNLVSYLKTKKIISKNETTEILWEKLTFQKWKLDLLPYVVDFLKSSIFTSSRDKNENIITTIDYNLSKKIDELSKNSIKSLAWKNVWDYSIIIIDKKTMDLKVMIGWNNYYTKEWQVNSSLALRQPGSTLKPFLYALAFQNFKKTPSSTILDLPVSYPTADGNIYEPKNYSLGYAGEINFAQALSQSINIPAVKILHEIGIAAFMGFLRNVWITSLNKSSDFYGLSLALWSWEISLYELARAYSLFSSKWNYCEINIIKNSQQRCTKIMDESYTNMVEEILTNRYFKLAWFPINSNLDFSDREVFVKTGTSRNFKDNWSIWYTTDYIIWVWVGNKDGSEMLWVSGASGAGDIFKKIVYILDNKERISNIISLDTEKKDYIKITSPLDKSVYKINSSLPIDTQKIKLNFHSNIDYDRSIWYIDNKVFEWEFLSISDIWKNIKVKVEVYKDGKNMWSDEIKIEVNK